MPPGLRNWQKRESHSYWRQLYLIQERFFDAYFIFFSIKLDIWNEGFGELHEILDSSPSEPEDRNIVNMETLSCENDNIEEVMMIAEEVEENGIEICESDIENVFHQNEQFDEVGGTEEDYIESENSDDENIFSVYQSNILYGLFLLGTILCISGDVGISFFKQIFS